MFKYNSKINISKITLKVKNLKTMSEYYAKLGFDILEKGENFVNLGIKEENKILLKLFEVENLKINKDTVGLYHTAYVLPSQKDLGNFLKYLKDENIKLIGMAHHGYSDAIYFEDPEGNGIEIYSDEEKEKWDVRENGEIVGYTKVFNTEKFLNFSDENLKEYKFPIGTKIGHLHFKIKEIDVSKLFEKVLEMTLKHETHGAKFYSSGNYHHHFAVNTWNTKYFSYPNEKDSGILSYEIETKKEFFSDILKNLEKENLEFKKINEDMIKLKDFNGIEIFIKYVK